MSVHVIITLTQSRQRRTQTCLRESAIIPDVTVMGETVAYIAQAALFDVLLDGIEWLLF